MQYELEVLTPLHIGCGRKITPMEWVTDMAAGQFVRVDMERLFRDRRFSADRFVRMVGNGSLRLSQEYPFAKDYAFYRLHGEAGAVRELVRAFGRSGEVSAAMHDSAGWYVPGSSLKGVLRTLLFKGNREIFPRWEEQVAASLIRERPRKEWLAAPAERETSGRPNYSAFRALKISDSSVGGAVKMGLYVTKILSLRQHGYGWKQLPRENADDPSKATPLFFEALRPHTILCGSWQIDDRYLAQRDIPLVGKELFHDWQGKIRQVMQNYLQQEENFFRRLNLLDVAQIYRQLLDANAKLRENELIITLGWGTGYLTKTVREAISDDTFKKVTKTYHITVREGFPYPKTRKVVFMEGRPATVCGFVRLKLN